MRDTSVQRDRRVILHSLSSTFQLLLVLSSKGTRQYSRNLATTIYIVEIAEDQRIRTGDRFLSVIEMSGV